MIGRTPKTPPNPDSSVYLGFALLFAIKNVQVLVSLFTPCSKIKTSPLQRVTLLMSKRGKLMSKDYRKH